MKSLKALYKIGKGPSSSHTMGPQRAAKLFREEHPEAERFKVILYDSLAKTGKGHQTDVAVLEALEPIETELVWMPETDEELPHPNTMDLFAYVGENETGRMRVASVGGGAIAVEGRFDVEPEEIYPENSFADIAEYCRVHRLRFPDYVELREGPEIWAFLAEIWKTMRNAIDEGVAVDGKLPGGLEVDRYARSLFNHRHIDERPETRENRLVCAYAFAVSEQNASGGIIVTAPTCGACGIVPAVLRYAQEKRGFTDEQILRALATGGMIGNLVKTNASISGAECGCQAEIGTACSMAAAALAELYEMGNDQIEYAAEIAMEHHLGLTCDPICGLVQIPCIERNAVSAMRAINAVSLSNFLQGSRKISFDLVVRTMYETGRDLNSGYRETAEAGLAKLYQDSTR